MCLLPTAYQSDTNDYCSREGLNVHHLKESSFIYFLFPFFDLFCSTLILSKGKSMCIECGFLQGLISVQSLPRVCDVFKMSSDITESLHIEFYGIITIGNAGGYENSYARQKIE